jgi:glycosyltransferase involved in cell wall biosynthesis
MRNGGIGTYNWLMAHLLASQGWHVHVLYCGAVPPRKDLQTVTRRLREAGIGWSNLLDFEQPAELSVEGVTDIVQVYLAERVRYALEELHQQHRFDLIEFGEWGALGFRCIQAKRAGLAFLDTRLIVRLHSSSQWMREGNHQWLADPNEVEVDYCERYAFEHADIQVSPSRYMFDYARQVGWNVRPDACVIPYPYPEPDFVPDKPPAAELPELVFFGRLETRKGLEVFVNVVRQLDPNIKITFLGRVNTLGNGTTALQYIRESLPGRSYTLLTDYNREQALRYLAQGNRLAILASLADNSPFTLIECAVNGLPFLASRVGGIPELLPDECFQTRLLFEPNTRDLLRCLRAYLDLPADDRAELCQATRRAAEVGAHNRAVVDHYRTLVHSPQSPLRGSEAPELIAEDGLPLVTVAIAYYNLGAHLPATLASLAAQTYPNLEVIVLNDGSTDPFAQEVFAQQQALYPHFRFLSQDNAGIGATRNRGLAEARGEYFIPMDADNVARPHMIERFVSAMQRNPDLAALTCFCVAFKDEHDLQNQEYQYAYRPTGGPHILAGIKNIYGDANAIFRTAWFRASGGYETDRDSSWEDLEAFVKLVNAGYRMDTLPEYLFYYRHLETGFSRVTDSYLNQRRVLRQYYQLNNLPLAEGMALWTALVSLQKRNDALALRLTSLRYRVADHIHGLFAFMPGVKKGIKWLLQTSGLAWRFVRGGWRVAREQKGNVRPAPSGQRRCPSSTLTSAAACRSIPPALAGLSASRNSETISGKESGT